MKELKKLILDNSNLRRRIRYIFDRIADCSGTKRYESTNTAMILHAILPRLFVIWDNPIKKGVKVDSRGANYSGVFLPKMQKELKEAIKTCIYEKRMRRADSVLFIENQCGKRTLAKLVDEYNFMRYKKKHPELC